MSSRAAELKRRSLAFLFFVGLGFPTVSRAQVACGELGASHAALQQRPGLFASHEEWAAYKERESAALDAAALSIFNAYIDSRQTVAAFERCMRAEQWAALQNRLPFAFISESFKRLEAAGPAPVSEFARRALKLVTSGDLIRLGLQLPADADGNSNLRFGGFHRGQRGLYLNPHELPPAEWYPILIHEFTHALDPLLRESTSRAARRHPEDALASELSKSDSAEVRSNIRVILQDGFDRGFLGEVRAWTVTAHLQAHLVRVHGAWRPEWLEPMGGEVDMDPRRRIAHVFAFLDPRFTDPAEGIYANARIQAELGLMRDGFRRRPPTLGPLEQILRSGQK